MVERGRDRARRIGARRGRLHAERTRTRRPESQDACMPSAERSNDASTFTGEGAWCMRRPSSAGSSSPSAAGIRRPSSSHRRPRMLRGRDRSAPSGPRNSERRPCVQHTVGGQAPSIVDSRPGRPTFERPSGLLPEASTARGGDVRRHSDRCSHEFTPDTEVASEIQNECENDRVIDSPLLLARAGSVPARAVRGSAGGRELDGVGWHRRVACTGAASADDGAPAALSVGLPPKEE